MRIQKSTRFSLLLGLVLAILLAACGGGPAAPADSPNAQTGGTPEDAARSFFTNAMQGNDVSALICSSNAAGAASIQQGMDALKTSLAASGATIDTSGLTFTKTSESGDTAEVEVGGVIKLTIGETATEQPYPAATITLKNESGWKVCG
ncbi:MAG: hypothetical protein JNJ78_16735 [Anaerolineae bacterium]|nr:hypothetical protein [Anaerolineae bacterium]